MKLLASLLIVISTLVSCSKTSDLLPQFSNADFYSEDGVFQEEKAKDAIIVLMKHHRYPVYDGIREKLWVSDYGTGKFADLGLAAHLFKNNEQINAHFLGK